MSNLPSSASKPKRTDQRQGRSGAILYITMITAVAALGGLLFGFDTGVIAGAMLFIVPAFHLGPAEQGLVVSAVTFGALFGALAGGASYDRIGRRWTNIVAGITFIVGSLLSAIASSVDVLIVSGPLQRGQMVIAPGGERGG